MRITLIQLEALDRSGLYDIKDKLNCAWLWQMPSTGADMYNYTEHQAFIILLLSSVHEFCNLVVSLLALNIAA